MKKYLAIIFAALFVMNVFMGCTSQRNLAVQNSVPEQSSISSPNTLASTSESEELPDNSFRKEDYQKLLALQLDGYVNMTISDYQSRIAKLTDSAEYRDLLERFWKSQILYELRDINETAYFLFYVLPLAGDDWKIRNYSGEVTSSYPENNARLEYSFSLTILDAGAVKIKDYDDMRLGVIDVMQDILKNRTKEELRNEFAMQEAIQAYVDDALRYMQTPEMSVAIEFAYFPLSAQEEEQKGSDSNGSREPETRRYSSGTEDDYHSLLALKTPDYQNMPVADFNSALLAWANEDCERMERIDEDIKWNDFPVALTAEELSFLKWTVFLSGVENGKEIQSIYTGTEPDRPCYGEYLSEKTINGNRNVARCSLYYQFSYSISETEAITVGERDRQIEGMIHAVETFWGDTDVESALKMSESDIVKELEAIAKAYSTNDITIMINKEKIYWECMDEREYMN